MVLWCEGFGRRDRTDIWTWGLKGSGPHLSSLDSKLVLLLLNQVAQACAEVGTGLYLEAAR